MRHFARKRNAERWLASQGAPSLAREWVDPTLSKITIGELLPQALARQVQLKPTTMVRNASTDLAAGAARTPGQVTHPDVSSWVHSLTDEGLAPATVRYAHRVLSLAPTAAVRAGRLVRNVAEGVPLPRVVGNLKRFLTHDQVFQGVRQIEWLCTPHEGEPAMPITPTGSSRCPDGLSMACAVRAEPRC